jgi:hypothetical protein
MRTSPAQLPRLWVRLVNGTRGCWTVSALAVLAAVMGCNNAPPGRPAPNLSPQSAVEQALAEYDANKDGALDAKELERSPGLNDLLVKLKGPSGRLTADDLTQQFQILQERSGGLMTCTCQVLLDGRPLTGATVRFVPEKILGPGYKPASGTTDAGGAAVMAAEGEEHGVMAGLYRVEVSKKNDKGQEAIPARYNTQTTLGCQVGLDTRSVTFTIPLRLSSR